MPTITTSRPPSRSPASRSATSRPSPSSSSASTPLPSAPSRAAGSAAAGSNGRTSPRAGCPPARTSTTSPASTRSSSSTSAATRCSSTRSRWSCAGIGDDVRDPAGGSFERDDRGRPTGIVRDTATNLVLGPSVDIGHHGPNFHTELAVDEGIAMLEVAAPRFHAAGITTVGDPQVTRRELAVYREAHTRGTPGPRVSVLPLSNQLDALLALGIVGPAGRRSAADLRPQAVHGRRDHRRDGGLQRRSRPGPQRGDLVSPAGRARRARDARPRRRLAAGHPHHGRYGARGDARRHRGRAARAPARGPAPPDRARHVPDRRPSSIGSPLWA